MIIDFHTHVFPAFLREKGHVIFSEEKAYQSLYSSPRASVAGISDLLRDMDEAEIHWSVIFGFPWEKAERFQRHNDYIMEAVHRHPERLIGFCSFSPLSPQGPREAERCLQSGLSGVGELALYGAGLSSRVTEALKDVMALCSQFDAPLLLHTNEPVGPYYAGKTPMTLGQIYRFLKAYPSNRIVLAHWGGGLFFYGLMKKEVRNVLRNVWFDTAASPFLYMPAVYKTAGEIVGYEKILFGSDYPLIKPQRYFDEMASENLTPRHTRQIIGSNAAQLLGLPD
ncbi:MAG: amidohydrolase family protein [Deltaproteobacteria bacterium]|nr:amidohydrolase family protein [Deltaproteobacteria bacterium]